MSTKRYTDWRTWWDGLRTNVMKCIGATGTSWLGSNAVDTVSIPHMPHIGLNWEQACGLFGVHIAIEVFSYMKDNQPKVVTEQTDTLFLTKKPSGEVVSASSSTTVTTPVVSEITTTPTKEINK